MLCFVFAALVVLLDQFIKQWVVRTLPYEVATDLIPGLIGLFYTHNSGAAFSLLAGQRWILAGISLIASIVLVFVLLRYTEGFWGTLGLSAVLGGAVGNLVDRVFHGYVVDMFRFDFAFKFEFLRFIFNVADVFITLGFVTFCIHFIASSVKAAKKDKKDFTALTEQAGELDVEIPYPYDIDLPDYDDSSDTQVVPTKEISARRAAAAKRNKAAAPESAAIGGQAREHEQKGLPSWQEYYEPVSEDPPQDVNTVLDALSALDELEKELGLSEDFDVSNLLRDYGFEEENNNNN